MLLLFRATKKM